MHARKPLRRSFWNQIPDDERQQVVGIALDKPEMSCRELAYHITDTKRWFISESSVYSILKAHNLITSPAFIVNEAADEFKDKTVRIHQLIVGVGRLPFGDLFWRVYQTSKDLWTSSSVPFFYLIRL